MLVKSPTVLVTCVTNWSFCAPRIVIHLHSSAPQATNSVIHITSSQTAACSTQSRYFALLRTSRTPPTHHIGGQRACSSMLRPAIFLHGKSPHAIDREFSA